LYKIQSQSKDESSKMQLFHLQIIVQAAVIIALLILAIGQLIQKSCKTILHKIDRKLIEDFLSRQQEVSDTLPSLGYPSLVVGGFGVVVSPIILRQ
jgi:hypothetical protein